MITNEELLRPRFKVIADYPGCEFEIGYIINLVEIYPYSGQSYSLRGGRIVAPSYFEKYPAIFQPLQWWEEREESDLPEYVKTRTGEVCKVAGWNLNVRGLRYMHITDCIANYYPDQIGATPATQEEYESFKAEKK